MIRDNMNEYLYEYLNKYLHIFPNNQTDKIKII